jgi:hypothetical protein
MRPRYERVCNTVICMESLYTRFGVVTGFTEHLEIVSISNATEVSQEDFPYSLILSVRSSKLLYDSRSVSQSVMSRYRAPLWDLRPDITSCRNIAL